jgi:membrane associated rhomboid family serine protease
MVLPLGDTEPTRTVPVATYALIALNVLMFLVQLARGEAFTTSYAATPYEITHGEDIPDWFALPLASVESEGALPSRDDIEGRLVRQEPVPFPVWLTLLTSLFLHGSPLHLAGNMLFLWIFGDNVEDVLGHARYVVVYLACGLSGSLAQVFANPDSLIPTLGASGAIAGVMGIYMMWFPYHRVRVLLLNIVVEFPAVFVIGFWIAAQVWSGLGSIKQLGLVGGVAYLSHLGGAACGVIAALIYRGRARRLGHPGWGDRVRG